MAGSSYTQLAPYLLLEYIYGDESDRKSTTDASWLIARLKNDYDSSQYTFLNTNAARNTSGNVLDFTAANLGGVDWVILDKDVPVPYITQDSKLSYEAIGISERPSTVLYDTVRFHIQSGYNLEGIEGLLFQIYVREAQTELASYLTSNVVLKGSDRFVFNPNPIFITDRIYDRYIEIKIPSAKDANQKYYGSGGSTFSVGHLYTTDGRGYLYDTQIYIDAVEIATVTKKNGITYFKTDVSYEATVRQEDIYTDVNAVIRESSAGDFFEYYVSFQGNYPADLIEELNSQGGDYVIIHQLDVTEQIDTRFVVTNSFTQVQTGGYEEPLLYRPILKYAGVSPSFSIDYTARVYNQENGYQIIKTSSVTSFNPTKYGKNIEKIGLSNVTSPLKVYNKVYGGASLAYSNPLPTNNFNTVYVPVFYDSKTLYTGTTSVLAPGQDPLNPNFNSNSIYFAQGAARLYLGDFEQYVKFSMKQYSSRTNTLNGIDLSGLALQIGFEDTNGNIFTYPALSSTIESPLSSGEVVFKIGADARKRIGLDGSNVKNFYVLSFTPGTGQTKMYVGSVDYDVNLSKEDARVKELGSQAVTIESLLAAGNATVTASQNNSISLDLQVQNSNNSLLAQLSSISSGTITGAEATQEVLPPVIPGFTTDTNASSVNAIVPTGK
jgi:hypothetical protein